MITITQTQKSRAQELLSKPKNELYNYYLSTIASPYILAKTERGRKICFGYWLNDLEFQAQAAMEA